MNAENINISGKRPKILVVPLDWGLGHATRCIPVIKILIEQNVDVVLAGEGAVVFLLHKEFPDLVILKLKGYRIKYSKTKSMFAFKILSQLPRIFNAIRHENNWLKKIIKEHQIDGVISDNRPGLYNKDIHCTYITHQLSILTHHSSLDKFVQKLHYSYIHRFDACWIPDNKKDAIAGVLSHPITLPDIRTDYIGLLSRFEKKFIEKKYDLLLLISGPEPQRSMLETILLKELEGSDLSFVLIRGLPENKAPLNISHNKAVVYDHLPASQLSTLIAEADVVIARSGYSTIMDLVRLEQKAVLIPTPGQTEQEYLAKYLMGKGLFYAVDQKDFSLEVIMQKIKTWQPDFSGIHSGIDKGIILENITRIFEHGF